MRRRVAYLGEVVHHETDDHGSLDVVAESDGRLRSLHFGSSARQSTMFVDRPDELALEYTRCMMTALPFLAQGPRRALMLGLGGGSLVKFLLRRCAACRVDVVELRPRVVELARRFFALPATHPRLQVHVGDAGRFLARHEGPPWDLILVDLHGADGMAPVVRDAAFAPTCRCHLAAAGVLAANLWYGEDRQLERQVRDALRDSFARVLYLPVAGKRNCIALGLPAPGWPPARALETRARTWQAHTGLDLPELLAQLRRHNPTKGCSTR